MNRIIIAMASIAIVYFTLFYFYDRIAYIDTVYKTARVQNKTQNNTTDVSGSKASIKTTTQSESIASIKATTLTSVQVTCNPIIENAVQEKFMFDNVAYPRFVPLALNKSINFTCLNLNKKPKMIMYWTKNHHHNGFNLGKRGCPATNCELTNNHNRINESSLILFMIDGETGELPKWRTPEQRWVFVLYESVQRTAFLNLTKFNGLFNLSSTSSANSDTVKSYASYWNVKWELNNDFDVNQNFMENRTGMAFQVASHCKPPSGRHIYIAELKKHIQVEVYGKCGKPCSNQKDKWLSEGCFELLIPQYKFYLSFENSICEEYITEKFFRLFKYYNIIPVVYGGGPYDKYIPKSGFINPFDFESPRHLAEYMTKVASNETLYNSYFEWKRYIKPTNILIHPICELCIKLNLDEHFGVKQSVIKDMNAFWNKTKECKSLNTTTFKLQSL